MTKNIGINLVKLIVSKNYVALNYFILRSIVKIFQLERVNSEPRKIKSSISKKNLNTQ